MVFKKDVKRPNKGMQGLGERVKERIEQTVPHSPFCSSPLHPLTPTPTQVEHCRGDLFDFWGLHVSFN